MKHTTEAHIRRIINAEVFDATDKLRKELYLKRASDNDATVKLVEATSEYLQQYVRDMNKAPTMRPNQVPPVAVGSPLIGSPPTGFITNKELAYSRGYSNGHVAAIAKVLDLFRTLPSGIVTDALVGAVKGLSL